MAINRAKIAKELEPGLNAIFGTEYKQYEMEDAPLFSKETSNRAFEEEVLFPGFDSGVVKTEGAGVTYAETQEGFVARYNMQTYALAFAITEEAMEDNLYDKLSTRLTKALARAMAHRRQVTAADILNNGFDTAFPIGDGAALFSASHPSTFGSQSNLGTAADLSETSIEDALIAIEGYTDDKGIPIAAKGKTLIIPRQALYVAERILMSMNRVATADNDINAMKSTGQLPGGYFINHRLTDTDAWFIITDVPNGLKCFDRVRMQTKMEGDFETGNMRYKARERYAYGTSDWRGAHGNAGA